MKPPRDNVYTLDLTGAAVGLVCHQPPLAVGLAKWFGRPGARIEPTIDLGLEFVDHRDEPHLPTSLLTTKRLTGGGGFDIADGLITGTYDARARTGELKIKAILLEGLLMRIFEQVLYQAHASARQAAGCGGFLVHSAAVIADGRGFLFVGPSESGKTTAARHSSAWHVLGDEMNLVVPTDDGYLLAGTPFNGTFRDKQPGSAPLAGIFLLQQAPRHALATVEPAAAAMALAAEIMPPVGLDQVPDNDTVPTMMDLAARMTDKVPVARLELLPDPGFWNIIGERFSLAPSA